MQELDSLRRRLCVTFSILTVLVLTVALGVTCRMAVTQHETSARLLLNTAFAAVEDATAGTAAIQDSWLAAQEAATLSVIYIEDGSVPLAFPGAWQPEGGRDALIALAKPAAEAAGLNRAANRLQRVEFAITAPNGKYACMAAAVPRGGGTGAVAVYMIRDTTAEQATLQGLYLRYLLLWAAGAVVLVVLCVLQIRSAIRPTAAAIRAQREFVAAAGHELRSPLAVVKANVQAAQNEKTACGPLPKGAASCLRAADAELDRMARLTGDLLLLAGSDAGVWRAALTAIPADTFLIELYERFYLLAKDRGHELKLELPDEALPTVQADAERLEQLFAVLLNNALEYAPAGTPIEMTAALHKGALWVSVADHGPGIPDTEKQKVFERFYRADASRTDKAHFGLGLSVAAQLAALHGAGLSVTDTPGGGATFWVRFAG